MGLFLRFRESMIAQLLLLIAFFVFLKQLMTRPGFAQKREKKNLKKIKRKNRIPSAEFLDLSKHNKSGEKSKTFKLRQQLINSRRRGLSRKHTVSQKSSGYFHRYLRFSFLKNPGWNPQCDCISLLPASSTNATDRFGFYQTLDNFDQRKFFFRSSGLDERLGLLAKSPEIVCS